MKKQVFHSALLVFTLFLTACSGGDDSEHTNPQTTADNKLYVYTDARINGTYSWDTGSNTGISGLPVPFIGSDTYFYQVVNGDLITTLQFRTVEENTISLKLNASSIPNFQLDANSCYEVSFTDDDNGVGILGDINKVDCN
jgi:hypothetical protein